MPNQSTTEWRNIFGLYHYKKITQQYKLLLAVSVKTDQSKVTLKIDYRWDISKSYKHKITKKVNTNNWINLKISQMNGRYEIKVDYKLVYSKVIPVPMTSVDFKLITGKPGAKENISNIGHYRNFKINTCKITSKKLMVSPLLCLKV